MISGPEVTFFTICNEPFFPGTVALLNSLRLTGNRGSLVVLDVGLSKAQRARLGQHSTIVRIPAELKGHPGVFKAFPRFFDPHGVVVIIDSDMIVSRPLAYIIERAVAGKICVFPDHFSQAARWFHEWETALELRAPLRRQTYVNSGFIALSISHWPRFLDRFWELSEQIPLEAVFGPDAERPFWPGDQDVLNALLMSEVPADLVDVLPPAHEVHPDGLTRTKVVDADTLECSFDGERPAILHYSMAPKAWDPSGWLRVRRDAYVRLFPRVVCGEDVAVRMEPKELPLWLRPGATGRTALTALDVAHGTVAGVRRRLPHGPPRRSSGQETG